MTTRRALGAVLVLVAAGLALAATFLTVYTVQADFGRRPLVLELTPWGTERNDFPGGLLFVPVEFGWPVVTAALLMALSAVLSFRLPVVRIASLLGVGLLAGTTWYGVIGYSALSERLKTIELPLTLQEGDSLTLLVVASAVGVLAAVLHQELLPWQRADRAPRAEGVVIHQLGDPDDPGNPDGDDSDTPPYGFPVIVEPKK